MGKKKGDGRKKKKAAGCSLHPGRPMPFCEWCQLGVPGRVMTAEEATTRHQPRRGDDVEAWLKNWRDVQVADTGCQSSSDPLWGLVDQMVNDYRLYADTGTPLDIKDED